MEPPLHLLLSLRSAIQPLHFPSISLVHALSPYVSPSRNSSLGNSLIWRYFAARDSFGEVSRLSEILLETWYLASQKSGDRASTGYASKLSWLPLLSRRSSNAYRANDFKDDSSNWARQQIVVVDRLDDKATVSVILQLAVFINNDYLFLISKGWFRQSFIILFCFSISEINNFVKLLVTVTNATSHFTRY